jgi:hypothetical protein
MSMIIRGGILEMEELGENLVFISARLLYLISGAIPGLSSLIRVVI